MFGSKKKETSGTTTKMNHPSGSHSLNTLVHGTTVEGAIKTQSDIRVDGIIKGSLHCKAKVIIGPTGYVDGEIRCVNAVIEGKFEGTLHVTELLNIRETAKVNGDVKTNKLIVQSGAIFNVTCIMGKQTMRTDNKIESSIKGSKAVVSNTQQQTGIKEAS
ncbi:MAG TPA: polymer-forming cytoskeletal protein [Phaeodactylibacter sp.]|nr:polymer-forming cytoskeletal protein [Phaeodactylibacter sp.]